MVLTQGLHDWQESRHDGKKISDVRKLYKISYLRMLICCMFSLYISDIIVYQL